MLERAVTALKNGEEIDILDDEINHIDVELNIPALIPDEYIFDVFTRLTFYKRMNNAKHSEALDELKVELIDRFGPMPEQAQNLFYVLKFKQKAKQLNIKSLVMNEEYADIKFAKQSDVLFSKLIQLLQKQPEKFNPLPDNGLRYVGDFLMAEQRIDAIHHLFDILQS